LLTANSLIERRSLNLLASAAVRMLLINGGLLFFESSAHRELGSEETGGAKSSIEFHHRPLRPLFVRDDNNDSQGLKTVVRSSRNVWRLSKKAGKFRSPVDGRAEPRNDLALDTPKIMCVVFLC